jgi:hypothetical protein
MARAKLVMIAVVSLGLLAAGASSAAAQRRAKKPAPPPPVAAPAPTPVEEAATAVPASAEPLTITPAGAGTGTGAGAGAGAETGAGTGTGTLGEGEAERGEGEAERGQGEAELQRELSEVMDSLVQARARAAVLGKALWKTTVAIKVDNRAEDQVAVRVALWLDGAPVWSGDGSALSDPERTMFSGFLAPGQHVLTYEVEQRARADEKYRYTLRASHRFTALRERRSELRLVLEDDSDIAEDFADDEEGEYDVRARLQVRAISPDDD